MVIRKGSNGFMFSLLQYLVYIVFLLCLLALFVYVGNWHFKYFAETFELKRF